MTLTILPQVTLQSQGIPIKIQTRLFVEPTKIYENEKNQEQPRH